MTITGNFERAQNVNFEKRFLKNQNFFEKTGGPFFISKYYESKKNVKTN